MARGSSLSAKAYDGEVESFTSAETFGVADRPMAVHLCQLGVDQVVQMLLVTWHGRRKVGPLQLQDLDRSVGLDRRRSRLKHLGELVGSKEDWVLDAVDIT